MIIKRKEALQEKTRTGQAIESRANQELNLPPGLQASLPAANEAAICGVGD